MGSKGVCFWLGMIVGVIVAAVSVVSAEEVESNGDKAAKGIPERHSIDRE